MKNRLNKVLHNLGVENKSNILSTSRFYREVNIGEQAEKLGFHDLHKDYRDAYAIVPLKEAVQGMKVRIDGRTFVNYAQFESGIAVPGYVASKTRLPYKAYVPNDSMILNCG